jgi:hypothetical protein
MGNCRHSQKYVRRLALSSIISIFLGFVGWSFFSRYWLPRLIDSSVNKKRQIIQDAAWRAPPLSWHRGKKRHESFDTSIESSSGGISFRRHIETYDPVSFLFLNFDGSQDGKRHCHSSDQFGDNACHFDWNDHLVLNYSVFVNATLTEEAYVSGVFEVCNNPRNKYKTATLQTCVDPVLTLC